ncbi:MAG TPA: S46 family peptidase [Candidatus Aminicenantes bacterium]|nr:S46 family peptidase [Candidatus Aminicenantes bacterium]
MRCFLSLGLLLLVVMPATGLQAEEGMWPLSEIHKLDLASRGLLMDPLELYNPDGVSLIDGIINLSGCTASFISTDGLILTNYHCAFRAIQSATSAENDLFENGFMAEDRSKELSAPGYTVRIIDSYRDVSNQVLAAVSPGMPYARQTRAREKRMKSIVQKAEKAHPGKRASVAEMFPGKTYVLFVYTDLRDIRLVYAPPRSIGEFGGEEDNWMWPRHTGDFALLRAYTGPDGEPADRSENNRPYHPEAYLHVNPDGVSEGDFVFIPGYPGRTYRHRTSYFLEFEENRRMPWVVTQYQWMINVLEKMSMEDHDAAIQLAPRLKGLWNVMKNYRGKLKGMRQAKITAQRRNQEEKIQAFILSQPELKEKYGSVLDEIRKVYEQDQQDWKARLACSYLPRAAFLLGTAHTLYEAAVERRKPDLQRKSAYMDRNFTRLSQRILRGYRDFYLPADRALTQHMLSQVLSEPDSAYVEPIRAALGEKELPQFIQWIFRDTEMVERACAEKWLKAKPEDFRRSKDPMIRLALALHPVLDRIEEEGKARKGRLDEQLARLVEVKRRFLGRDFIPDANGTLRLTMGRIRGYSPADAVKMAPLTTLGGLVEKHRGQPPFIAPERLRQLVAKNHDGGFADPVPGQVPVAMLYDCDTTGGNSGSPVLDARGKLVGLNFDRVFEATVNDYAWSDRFSRSIGVDIRFILWFLSEYSGAHHLVREMGVAVSAKEG